MKFSVVSALMGSFLILGLCPGKLQADDQLILYFIPPTLNINYSSPKSLVRSLHGAKKRKVSQASKSPGDGLRVFTVGHTLVEINCEAWNEREHFHGWSAVDDKDPAEEEILLELKMVGFGFPFIGTSGELVKDGDVYEIFEEVVEYDGKMAVLRFILEPEQCHSIMDKMQEFEEQKIYENFGLNFDPLKAEGAGCASYGISLVDSLGVLPESWKQEWRRQLLVPEMLIGGMDTGREIDLSKLDDIPESKRWATVDEDHRPLEFYDLQLLYDWIKFKAKRRRHSDDFEIFFEASYNQPIYSVDLRGLMPH